MICSIILCIMLSSVTMVTGECNPDTGPVGIIECYRSSERYNYEYQWGTCLSHKYINEKSNKKYECPWSPHCYFPCMLELHDIENGTVYADCSCKAGEEFTESNLTLQSHCYSPFGVDCGWYSECLQRRYTCNGSNDDYGVAFAKKICSMYDKNYEDFSTEGQLWIDSVRKCLQFSLVPIIRPWQSFYCNEIKEKTIALHDLCYISPSQVYPNITVCNLELSDFLRAFWTIKSSLAYSFSETVYGFWKSMTNCSSNIFENVCFTDDLRNVELTVLVTLHESTTFLNDSDKTMQNNANSIVNKIAEQLNWKNKGVTWFSYANNTNFETQKQEMSINIYLAIQRVYDLNAKNISSADMNDTISDFLTKVQEGTLFATTEEFTYEGTSMKGCLDFECEEILFEVIAPHKDQHLSHIIIGAVCGVIVLVWSGVAISCSIRKR